MGALTPRRLARASSRTTSPLILSAYLWHPMPWMARAAAVNPSTPRFARQFASRRELLLDITLSSPDVSPALLKQHVSDPSCPANILRIIAVNPSSSAEILTSIANHDEADVTVWANIVSNPSTPIELIEQIILEYGSHPQFTNNGHKLIQSLQYACAREDLSAESLSWIVHNCKHPNILSRAMRHPNISQADAVLAALSSGYPRSG